MNTLSGRPLLSTDVDRLLCVGRSRQIDALSAAASRDVNVLLVAEPGGGLTTALHQLSHQIDHGQPGRARFINAAGLSSVESLLEQVAGDLTPTVAVVGRSSPYARFSRYANLSQRIVALVDNLAPELGYEAFGHSRDEIWAVPITWVVACSTHEQARFLQSPATAFFDLVLVLPALTDVEAASLIRRRTTKAELDAAGLRAVVDVGEGNPRALVSAARQLVLNFGTVAQLHRDAFARAQIAQLLSRPATMLLAELQSLGPSSASDQQLQDRLGWTRARLVQVFAELQRSGAVRVQEVRTAHAGRPRKIYTPMFC
ncbi:MAG: hypothetical protein ABI137_05190 [Antricoccus sp.]